MAMATFASQLQVSTKNTFLHCEDREGEHQADELMTRSLSCPAFMTDVTTVPCRSPCPSVVKSSFQEDDRYSSASTANQDESDVECLSASQSESSRTNSPLNIGSRTNSPCNLGVVGNAVPMVLAPNVVPVMPQEIQVVETPMPTPQQAIQQATQFDLPGPVGQVTMLAPQQAIQQLSGPAGQVAMPVPQQAFQQPSGTVPATQRDLPGPAGQVTMLAPQQAIQQLSGQVPTSSSGSQAALQVPAAAPANETRAPTSKTTDQQKRINRELVVAGKRSSLEVLKVVQRNLGQMNGVNLSTAFHRISRGAEERVTGSDVFRRLLEAAERYAEQELANRGSSLPANCCTIIAWSCAQLRVFPPSLFAKLAAIATPQLRSCQAYEITNLLWAFAEFYKYEQDTANGVVSEVRALLDSVAEVFSGRRPGDFKVQVLTSALMSVSALPWNPSFSSTWLLNSSFQELFSRWGELELEGQAQVAVALERLRVKCAPFFESLLRSAGQEFPAVKISLEAYLLSRAR
ncbi:hypothetical protein AK812_SmicGene37739 [Symbiodinium microadriaticum]|uniref:Uncharacterized protein n=1 Tax=Symbiodinium microadriaticum TaxID=2951 RepID=A0A1Q9CFI6_SYMMI|nr:hypothetical protein AK812_SmicGene37739 [Symbiodinium microadriaticum]CAE7581216.1 unnamed protein product [Symbiodinium microadriaticum]